MKALNYIQPVENKKSGLFSFLRKNTVRTLFFSQYGKFYFAFDKDVELVKKYFKVEDCDWFDNVSVRFDRNVMIEMIKFFTSQGYRLAIKGNVPK